MRLKRRQILSLSSRVKQAEDDTYLGCEKLGCVLYRGLRSPCEGERAKREESEKILYLFLFFFFSREKSEKDRAHGTGEKAD